MQAINYKAWPVILGFIVVFLSAEPFACSLPSRLVTQPYTDLVGRTKNIVLAELIETKLDRGMAFYNFKKIKSLKGDEEDTFTLTIENRATGNRVGDLNGHRYPEFWDKKISRSVVSHDCTVLPNFEEGKSYLLFLDKPYHIWGFEEVADVEDDLWMEAVTSRVEKRPASKISFVDYLKWHRSVYLAECKSLNGGGVRFLNIKHVYGDVVAINPDNVDFGRLTYSEAGCRGRLGQPILIVYYRDIDIAKGYPVRSGAVDISKHDTQIKFKEGWKVTVSEILHTFK